MRAVRKPPSRNPGGKARSFRGRIPCSSPAAAGSSPARCLPRSVVRLRSPPPACRSSRTNAGSPCRARVRRCSAPRRCCPSSRTGEWPTRRRRRVREHSSIFRARLSGRIGTNSHLLRRRKLPSCPGWTRRRNSVSGTRRTEPYPVCGASPAPTHRLSSATGLGGYRSPVNSDTGRNTATGTTALS